MALQVTVSVSQQGSCGTLRITDTTGEYSPANPTGWSTSTNVGGTLVLNDSSIDTAYIELTSPDTNMDIVHIDLMDPNIWQEVTIHSTGLPFDSSVAVATLYFDITTAIAGLLFVDGVWTIKYYVATGNIYSVTEFNVGLYCNIECCIKNLLRTLPDHYICDNCSNKYVQDVLTAKALFESLKLAAQEAQPVAFNNIKTTLTSICELLGESCTNC